MSFQRGAWCTLTRGFSRLVRTLSKEAAPLYREGPTQASVRASLHKLFYKHAVDERKENGLNPNLKF